MNADQETQARSISNTVAILDGDPAFQTPRISKRLAELVEIDRRIWNLSAEQGSSSYTRGAATLKHLRAQLRKDHINPLSADGKLFLVGEPGIKDSLRLPHARASDAKLIEAARRITSNIRPFKETFIQEGYRPDFLERAEQAIDRFERITSQPPDEVTRRSRATRELPEAIRRGRRIMDAIDRLIQTDLAGDKLNRAMWKKTYRLPRKIGRPKAKRSRGMKRPDAEA
jgi:hypothetical protein